MIQGQRLNPEDNCTNPSKGRSICFLHDISEQAHPNHYQENTAL